MAVADKGDTGMAKGSAARMIRVAALTLDPLRNPAKSGLRGGQIKMVLFTTIFCPVKRHPHVHGMQKTG